jgi:hypothetical protein
MIQSIALSSHIPRLLNLSTPTSDHIPFLLKFTRIDNLPYRSFFFERCWLCFQEAKDIMHTGHSIPFTTNPDKDLSHKFKSVRATLNHGQDPNFRGLLIYCKEQNTSFNSLIGRRKNDSSLPLNWDWGFTFKSTPYLAAIHETKWKQRYNINWLKNKDI